MVKTAATVLVLLLLLGGCKDTASEKAREDDAAKALRAGDFKREQPAKSW